MVVLLKSACFLRQPWITTTTTIWYLLMAYAVKRKRTVSIVKKEPVKTLNVSREEIHSFWLTNTWS